MSFWSVRPDPNLISWILLVLPFSIYWLNLAAASILQNFNPVLNAENPPAHSFLFFFFLLCTIFKVFIDFVTISLLLLMLGFFWQRGIWDLTSFPDQELNPHPLHWKAKSTTGPPGNSFTCLILNDRIHQVFWKTKKHASHAKFYSLKLWSLNLSGSLNLSIHLFSVLVFPFLHSHCKLPRLIFNQNNREAILLYVVSLINLCSSSQYMYNIKIQKVKKLLLLFSH